MRTSPLTYRRLTAETKALSVALLISVMVGQLVLGAMTQAADSSVSTEAFSDNSGITYSEVSGQPTGDGDFGNGAVAGYPEGACIPFFVELKNTTNGRSAAIVDVSITLVHDYMNSGIIGVTELEQIAQNAGTLQGLKDADNLNDIAFSGNEVTSITSVALSSGGSATAAVSGPYAGDEDDGTSPVTATDTKRHYLVTVQDIPVNASAYLYFCGRLGLDASEYPGASLSIGVSPPSGGVENTAIATNQVLALPSITLTKEVVGGDASADEWSFNVSPSINGQSNFPTTAIDADTASVTIENVSPDGAFTITESGPTGYPFTAGSGSNCVFTGSTATANVTAGDPATNATCVFTNTFEDTPPPPTTGTLTVYKNVTNDDGGTLGSANFSINVTDGDAYDNSFAGVSTQAGGTILTLEAGSYTVSETAVSGYAGDFAACGSEGVISVTAGQNVDCTITNNDIAPTLTVNKIVSGGNKDASEFTLLVDQTTVTNGVATPFDAGTYTVSEVNDPAYTAVISGDCVEGSVTLNLGDTKTCTITNTIIVPPEETGTITVVKNMNNDAGGTAVFSDFPLFIGATSVTSGEIKTLPVGNYTISETNEQANYVASFSNSCPQGSVNLDANETVVCTITNTYVPPAPTTGTLKVIKTVVGSEDAPSTFTLNVSGSNASPSSFPGSNAGTDVTIDINSEYSVSEDAVENYTVTYSEFCSGKMTANGATCTVTNTYQAPPPEEPTTGSLTVVKVVINTDGGTAQVSSFPLFIGQTQVTSGVASVLSAGTYTVSETSSASYVASFSGDCDASGIVTLAVNDIKTCTITNDDVPVAAPPSGGGGGGSSGTLTVVTNVINDDNGTALPSSFLMTVGDGISTSSTFGGVSTPGFSLSYAPGAYVVNSSINPAYARSMSPSCSGTITNGQSVTCVVTFDDLPAAGGSASPSSATPPPAAGGPPPQVLGATDTDNAPVPQVLGASDSDLPVTGMPAWTLASLLLVAAPFLRRKRS